jgi:hypothetical protein
MAGPTSRFWEMERLATDRALPGERLPGSTVTNNSAGLTQSGTAVIESRGTGTVRGNGTNVVGLVTPAPGE